MKAPKPRLFSNAGWNGQQTGWLRTRSKSMLEIATATREMRPSEDATEAVRSGSDARDRVKSVAGLLS